MKQNVFLWFLLLASLPALAWAQSPSCGPLQVPGGTVQGTWSQVDGEPICTYMGIPYAYAERWTNPGPPRPWSGNKGGAAGAVCPQFKKVSQGGKVVPVVIGEEDCLFLNVWAPAGGGANLPVMVWIHGGAFIAGAGSDPIYWGGYTAAAHDVVVVTLNYRLGAIGFLAGTAGLKGNFGLRDQQAALKWMQANITKFGGNPENVTIYGESAGAMSVGLHAASIPLSKGLFKAAIMESNPLGEPYRHDTWDEYAQVYGEGQGLRKALGCEQHLFSTSKTLLCLQEAPLSSVMAAQQALSVKETDVALYGLDSLLSWSPVIDKDFVQQQPIDGLRAGSQIVPMILGTNRNEGQLFIYGGYENPMSQPTYQCMIEILFGKDTADQIFEYAAYQPNESDNRHQAAQLLTDYTFTCANRYAAAGPSDLWAYQFARVPSCNIWAQPPNPAPVLMCSDFVCHGAEIDFVFNSAVQGCGHAFSSDEEALSELMSSYWASFATSQDPNKGTDGPPWPTFGSDKNRLVLNTPVSGIQPSTDLGANCDFWDTVGYSGHRNGTSAAISYCKQNQ